MNKTSKHHDCRIGVILLICFVGMAPAFSVEAQEYEKGFQARALRIISRTSDFYKPPSVDIGDPEKYYWPAAIARLEKHGVQDSLANRWIEMLAVRQPFHFTLVGMVRLMKRYTAAPAIQKHRNMILNNVFKRDDSFNAWTGEGTENHVNMSRLSGYIFAQEARKDGQMYPEAPLRFQQMDGWIRYWSKKMYTVGTGEWNSSTYEAYNTIGWLNAYDFAENEQIRSIAKAVLDYYACDLALHYSFGSLGGSEMRGTGKTLHTATSYLGWLWYGTDYDLYSNPDNLTGGQFIQIVHAATSAYRPPALAVALARKENAEPAEYRNSQPSYLLDVPSFVKQVFYVDSDFTLGSSMSPYGGFTGSTSQIVPWKLTIYQGQFKEPIEIGGNGLFYKNKDMSFSGKDPFTQHVQHRNVLVQLTKVPSNGRQVFEQIRTIVKRWGELWHADFVKRFPAESYVQKVVTLREEINLENKSFILIPKMTVTEIDTTSTVCFVRVANVALAIRSIGQHKPHVIETEQHYVLYDSAPPDILCGFVLEVQGTAREGSSEDFKKIARKTALQKKHDGWITYRSTKKDILEARYVSDGFFSEATSSWGFGTVAQLIAPTSPPLRQPEWPSGEGFGKIPQWRINHRAVDTEGIWPLWSGPDFTLDKNILTLKHCNHSYIVNFQNDLPLYFED